MPDKYVELTVPGQRRPGTVVKRGPSENDDPSGRRVNVHCKMAGEGPPLILIHGLGASEVVWKENTAVLAYSHTVYSVDLPGHELSDKPGNITYDEVAGAECLVEFMDVLGIRRSSLIGNSAGGLIAGTRAYYYPERVNRLVLVDSAGLGRSMAWFLRVTSLPLVGELSYKFHF